jgi:hypothetical protein
MKLQAWYFGGVQKWHLDGNSCPFLSHIFILPFCVCLVVLIGSQLIINFPPTSGTYVSSTESLATQDLQ